MKTGQFLHSKVGRRIFVLFIACALLPIIVFTLVSATFVTRQMESQDRKQLHQMAKSAGMELFRTIEIASNELTLAAAFVDNREGAARLAPSERTVAKLIRSFGALELLRSNGERVPIVDSLDLTTPALLNFGAQFEENDVLLSILTDADGVHRVYLGTTLDREAQDRQVLIGEIRPEVLHNLQQILPAQMELLILGPGQQPVVAPSGAASALPRESLVEMGHAASGQFNWTVDDEPQMARYWSVFFGPRYGSPNWTVVLTQPQVDSFSTLKQFGKLLPLCILLCLMIVVLMSMAQIRKSMIPLRKLQEGTERVALRRFDTKVEVDSGDEFESLADSFNGMASDLGRQFRTLTTLAEIDRAILSTVDEDRIVATILDRTVAHYSSDGVAVALTDPGSPGLVTVHVRWRSGDICDTTDHVSLETDDRRRLAAAPRGYLVCDGPQIPGFLRELRTQQVEHCVILPLSVRQGLAGCIAFGSRTRTSYREEDLQDLRRLSNQAAVALSNARLVNELERTNWETLRALARAVDANSPWTAGHSDRVTSMAVKLGQRLSLDEEELAVIHRGGLLHDIGKIGIPAEILDKPARLTAEEMMVMQSHPTLGARILEPISAYAREIPIVLYHHERFDGRGYPEGLAGEAIPRNARILAVADVFDALVSDRPYRKPWPLRQVLEFIRDGAGTQFDPQIVPVFLKMIDQETTVLLGKDRTKSHLGLSDGRSVVHS